MTTDPTTTRLDLLDLPLDPVTLEAASDQLSAWMFAPQREPHTVITLNPEIVVQSRTDETLGRAIRVADLVTADGVGIQWAARQLRGTEVPRAPGFDLATHLMARHGAALRVFFLGGKPGVPEAAARKAQEQHGVSIAGVHHGYFEMSEDQRVAELVRDSGAHLLLSGMGAPRQETFNQYWRQVMNVPVMIGVGGTLDVLAGTADLAPGWTRRAGVEWIWRVAGNRKRWNRAPRLLKFVRLVQAAKKQGTRPA
ncbi:WecB/TagA/CpsF family glycosyltransferase [Deinococcus maricopensis]|uniref:Glycosyl transferase, WecB/TagA/CpsF family n=1 Tax=Deinococcus maricopensis (strain DSM 21211 / LMG 22137 / NRRL B-23946 / LB-34) TaxID=709986 RepID=E8U995_DEIML|nr:WecB/TagA/CpsF family glycosyltransferase [Deinococcus maricopensis]ADV67634.1 glycosyl transferase, WecB/TagA/CpsF family [Deinococcus maricopensis DSM 21211]